jgi:hypothetical protein
MRRFRIQTPKRVVTHIITDLKGQDYNDIKTLLTEQGIVMDGLLIECNDGIGYVWVKKQRPPIFPTSGPDAATA